MSKKGRRLTGRQLRYLFATGQLAHGTTKGGKRSKKVVAAYKKPAGGGGNQQFAATRASRIAAGRAVAARTDPGMITLAKRLKGVKPGAIKGATGSRGPASSPTASYTAAQRAGLRKAREALQREANAGTRAARIAAGKKIASRVDPGMVTLAKRLKSLTGSDRAKLASRPKTLSPAKENRPRAKYTRAQRARLKGLRKALTAR